MKKYEVVVDIERIEVSADHFDIGEQGHLYLYAADNALIHAVAPGYWRSIREVNEQTTTANS